MKSSGSSNWSLDLNLIRKGGAQIKSPLTGRTEQLNWSVIKVPAKLLPISVVECRFVGMGRTVFGYGDGLLYTDSLTQAFAEAWERLWFDLLRDGPYGADGALRSSNGFACGATPQEAEAAARSELIERAVYLTAWNTRNGWIPIKSTGLLNRVLLTSLDVLGWEIALFRLSEETLGDVICGLSTRKTGGVLFDCVYQRQGVAMGQAQSKVLRSLLRSAVVLANSPASFAPLPERGGPRSHSDFYMDPANLVAFDFLKERISTAERIKLAGCDHTETRVLVDIEGFPCVAAATNPLWPVLSWGKESLKEGGNPWPHPLA